MSILIFLLILFVLILVHEWGHYITAKWAGMKVEEFGIGFPPRAVSWQRGETRWSLNWLPIGGFVKILGENGDGEKELTEEDKARAFGARPKWAQAIVLIAGVFMNVVLAWFLFVVTFMIGVDTPVTAEEAGAQATLRVSAVTPDSPAATLIQPGGTIVGVTADERSLENLTPTGLTQFINEVAPTELNISYQLGNELSEVVVVPVAGLLRDDPERYLIGISPVLVETRSHGFGEALVAGAVQTWNGLFLITDGLFTLIGQSIAGTADYTQVAGPVGIVGLVGDAASVGLVTLLTFTAFISLNLAIINLLPIPALDGGRLVFVAIESITRKAIPPSWAGGMNLAGFALLILLMIAVTYNDILRLL